MRVLIPILTGEEDEERFIDEVMEEGELEEVILLNVVKREEVGEVPAGYAGTKIKEAEDAMKKIKEQLPVNIEVTENIEWGDPTKKIRIISKIKNTDKVLLKQSEKSEEIKQSLEELGINTGIIEIEEPIRD